jgi:predicted thioesterase
MRLPPVAADWQDGAWLLKLQLPIMTLLETAYCSVQWCHLDKENRMELEAGATNTLTVVVDEAMTADRFGNTGVQVLATPMLVSYFELAAHQLAMRALGPGQGTVGSHVDIRHLAATPVGMRVTFRATLTERDGRRLLFRVEADDELERVGEGTHERFVVDMGRFMERIAAKHASTP